MPIANQNITKQRRSAGFTLAELLIVVAIITVLVAIAIPVFISATKTAEEATCSANRRSVRTMVADAYLLNQTLQVNDDLVKKYADALRAQNGDQSLCPTGGTYGSGSSNTENEDVVITIKCSIHGMGMDDEMYQWVLDNPALWDSPQHTDKDIWNHYKQLTGKDKWPVLSDAGDKPLYLKFKSFNKTNKNTFLFASLLGEDVGDHGQWKASYICDSTGLLGPASKGQWYKIETTSKDGVNIALDENGIRELLKNNQESRVNLVNGKFVPAS